MGVSGASWDVVEPMIAAGRMPHLARLREEGASATLRSVRADNDRHFRPQSAWATAATGVLPERHGVLRYFHEADDLRAAPIWELWDRNGLSVGIYGWPGTWPPRPIHGFVVPSHFARDARTWPPNLAAIQELDRLQRDSEREPGRVPRRQAAAKLLQVTVRHKVRPTTLVNLTRLSRRLISADVEEQRLLMRMAKLELNADVFANLRRRFAPDLASFHTFLADFAMHRYWRYREPELFGATDLRPARLLAQAIDDSHERIDAVLGRLVTGAPRGSVVAVVSEHGMAPEPDSPEHGTVYWSIKGSRVLELIGLPSGAIACPVARWVAYRAPPRQQLDPCLADRLRAIRVVETGRRLFHVDTHGDEVVIKLDLPAEMSLSPEGSLENLHARYGELAVRFGELARPLGMQRSAMHSENGLLVIAGPGIRRGLVLEPARLVDFAPTLLRAAGLPLPGGLDGEPLDLFT